MPHSEQIPRQVGVAFVAFLPVLSVACSPASIDVDTGTRFQTFQDWSATAEIGYSDFPASRVEQYREEMLDWVVDSLGITRLRLPIKSGYENHEDLAPAYFEDNSLRGQWVMRWFRIENDNDDPYVADPTGFQFFWIDHLMESIVLPVKRRLEAKGERLYLNLNYVDFGKSPFEHRDHPEEFAEFLLVVVGHLDEKFGVVADGIEILEPDNDGEWTARNVADGFVAAGRRLAEAGYDLDFIGPSNTSVKGALEYFDEMVTVPDLDRYQTELSYHKYRGTDPEDLREIARRGGEHGLRTSMLEYGFATTEDIYQDLALANVSVWQKFAILDYVQPDEGGRVHYRDDTRQMAQYMRNIRPGATRVAATSSVRSVEPVAFVDPDGRMVLVARTRSGRAFTVRGLPPSQYEAIAVLDDEDDALTVVLTRREDGALSGRMPGAGVLVVTSSREG